MKPVKKRYSVLPPIRCTEQDKTLIRQKADEAGLSLSEYVRRMSLEGKVVVRQQNVRFDFETARQLRLIGINLNQQTKRLNTFGELDQDHKRIWMKLETVLDEIMKPT